MDTYFVYMHINKENDKKYIGITCQDLNRRWKNGNGYKGSPKFYNAILKYGWDGFKHIVVAEGLSKDEACKMQVELIKQHRTQDDLFGYNLDFGGTASKHTDETKQKLKNKLTGRKFSDETIQRMKQAARKRGGHNHTEETKRKISQSKIGHEVSEETKEKLRKAFGKRILCVQLNLYFDSITEAANYFDVKKCTISSVLCGRNNTAKGYHFEYATIT